jgi:DNA polymerase
MPTTPPSARVPVVPQPPVAVAAPQPPAAATAATTNSLATIAAEIAACKKCGLHLTRTRTVPGQGHPAPEILFVGEGPGAEEDRQGLAFVGRAGQLLTKMIEAMGFTREQVFIANIVKCHPPGTETVNRAPAPEEMATCIPYLKAQIAVLKPKVIVALGSIAIRGLLNTDAPISKLRGTWQKFEAIPVMPTYHPAYLLRNPPAKKEVWLDLQEVLRHLGRTPPPPKPAVITDAP